MKSLVQRKAFTMIELLFVIVILGIVGTLALEALRQYYDGIYRTGEYTKRSAQADQILEQVARYFENGISASIVRLDQNDAALGSVCNGVPISGDDGNDYTIAFVGIDDDGLRGYWDGTRFRPGWSSEVINVGTNLSGPDSDYTTMHNADSLLDAANPTAIFRSDGLAEGSDCGRFGWITGAGTNQAYRTVLAVPNATNLTLDGVLSISGQSGRAYVLRTAYAFRARNGVFSMYSGFQPWNGELYSTVTPRVLGDNVAHFTIMYDASNTSVNSNVGNVYTLKICMNGVDANLNDSTLPQDQICRERMVHVRY